MSNIALENDKAGIAGWSSRVITKTIGNWKPEYNVIYQCRNAHSHHELMTIVRFIRGNERHECSFMVSDNDDVEIRVHTTASRKDRIIKSKQILHYPKSELSFAKSSIFVPENNEHNHTELVYSVSVANPVAVKP